MALSVSLSGYNAINLCENENDWTGSTPSDVTDFFKEGLQCIGFEFIDSGANDSEISVTEDLSGTTHLRMWFMCSALKELDTDANGGIQVYLSDGANTGYWNVSGSTTYLGGWYNLVVDLSAAVSSGTKPTMTTITTLGIRVNLTTGSKKAQNTWIDHIYAGDGLIVYGDNGAGGAIDFDDILAEDEDTTNGWGIIRKIGGIFYLNGSIIFGDAAGVNACEFEDLSQVLVFEDRPVNTSLYGFTVVDNGTGLTEFILGEKVGTAGIKGCIIRVQSSAQTPKFIIDGSDVDVDNFKLYGCTVYGSGAITFPGATTDVEILGCSFEACGQVDPDDASVESCFFINTSNVDAAVLWNESIDMIDCSFIGNTVGAGIEMPSDVGTPYAYNALFFSGNTYDVLNSSGSAISINKNNGADPTTYEGSSVTFLGTSVTTQITVKNVKDSVVIENARVVFEAADALGPLNYHESVTVSRIGDVAYVVHNGHGMVTNDWVRIAGANQDDYNICAQITVTTADAYNYAVENTPVTPATGTIVSTEVMFNKLTNVSGIVTDTRSLASNQNMVGRARKSSISPFYKTQPIIETIDKDNGLTLNVLLIPD